MTARKAIKAYESRKKKVNAKTIKKIFLAYKSIFGVTPNKSDYADERSNIKKVWLQNFLKMVYLKMI